MYDAEFSGRILPGERILWTGRPQEGLVLTRHDGFLIPFSVVWFSFVVSWMISAMRGGAPFDLFGIFFVLIGLFVTVGRFVLDAWARSGTRYAVTDRRVLILRTRPRSSFSTLALDRLPQLEITERADGRGTVRFGPTISPFTNRSASFGMWMPSFDPTPQFIAIPDARRVFDLVQRQARAE